MASDNQQAWYLGYFALYSRLGKQTRQRLMVRNIAHMSCSCFIAKIVILDVQKSLRDALPLDLLREIVDNRG